MSQFEAILGLTEERPLNLDLGQMTKTTTTLVRPIPTPLQCACVCGGRLTQKQSMHLRFAYTANLMKSCLESVIFRRKQEHRRILYSTVAKRMILHGFCSLGAESHIPSEEIVKDLFKIINVKRKIVLVSICNFASGNRCHRTVWFTFSSVSSQTMLFIY
ncbi:hypothetical protein AVEN_78524-1 [Araneus ventricosus]|uniref:Uncharacterized protein n=1 Tax=Araneus ventricosus TaxID=182803 RepID=A0A4Y2EMP6_ARAVE|nr:hypothetical protein AVEN_78524-1 [Araneus ventricosus]